MVISWNIPYRHKIVENRHVYCKEQQNKSTHMSITQCKKDSGSTLQTHCMSCSPPLAYASGSSPPPRYPLSCSACVLTTPCFSLVYHISHPSLVSKWECICWAIEHVCDAKCFPFQFILPLSMYESFSCFTFFLALGIVELIFFFFAFMPFLGPLPWS